MAEPLLDEAVLRDLSDTAGADFVGELVETFAGEAPAMLAELHAAQAAGAAERFRRAAHSLKSNANTFGALRLAEGARALELGGLPADTADFAGRMAALEADFAATLARLREVQHG